MSLSCIIIDDEFFARQIIRNYLKAFDQPVKVLAEAESVEDGFRLVQQHRPDFIFLDIKLNESNGFELLQQLGDDAPLVVFTTAYHNYAIKAIKHQAFDYLLKPIDMEEMHQTLNKIKQTMALTKLPDYFDADYPTKKIKLPTTSGQAYYLLSDILYCKAESNYTQFFLKNGKQLIVSKTLKAVEMMLESNVFVRVHQSYIVNLDHFDSMDPNDKIRLKNGALLPLSRAKKQAFLEILAYLS